MLPQVGYSARLDGMRLLKLRAWLGCDLTEVESAMIEMQADIARIDKIIKRLGG